MKKRILSILLTLCMVLMLCPVTAFADEHVYRVAGEPALCDSGWAATDDDNRMTYNGETGRYEKVYTGVRSGSYMYKIAVDGAWTVDVGEIKTVDVENDNATVTIWYDENTGEWGADVAYDTPAEPTLAVTVDGFEVGKTPADCTYSFESTIPGIEFSAADIKNVCWEEFVFYGSDYTTSVISNTDVFEADTRYQVLFDLNNKGLDMAPAVTVNGKTPEFCAIATSSGVPIRLQITCTLGTPAEPPAPSLVRGDIDFDGVVTVKDAIMLQDCLENPESLEKLTSEQYEAADFNGDGVVTESDLTALRSFLNPITIDGPDVVCSWQEYEFTVTPADGVTLDKEFGYDTGMKGGGADLTVDADGVGHGVVPTNWYDLQTNCFTLTAHGNTADGTPVTGTKTVQVSPEHIYVDGVCGCGAVQQYTVTYDGGEDSDPVTDVKTHGEPLTLRGETFKMDGFVQTGWVDKETGAIYDLGATYDEDRDATLYPYWEKLVTVTAPFTTTVALGDAGEPGETTFMLYLIDGTGNKLTYDDQYFFAEITTDGAGSYSGTMTITATKEWLRDMLYEGAFIWQYDGEEDGWTYDDTVWGVRLYMPEVAARAVDEASYELLLYPTYVMSNGSFNLNLNAGPVEEMTFTNTYTAHDYALKHDATHHWDECACKDVQNKELHKYGDWKVTKEATQTAKGEKEHTCTICGYTETAEIAKLPATTEPTNPDTDTKPDTKPGKDNPATGDNSHMALWIALLLVSGAGVIGTTVYSRKKEQNKLI